MLEEYDIVVIGGGIAGLVAGTVAAESGLRTMLVRKGQGATSYSSGAFDILGNVVESLYPNTPAESLSVVGVIRSTHPYRLLGISGDEPEVRTEDIPKRVRESINWLKKRLEGSCAELVGKLDETIDAITILGTTKPTCLVQQSMDMANLLDSDEENTLLFVDIIGHPDYNGRLAARTYSEFQRYENTPIKKVVNCSVELSPFGKPYNISSIEIARHLDHSGVPNSVLDTLRTHIENTGATHVALPPVMGLTRTKTIMQAVSELGVHPFELLSFPPSVPGMRLQQALDSMYVKSGGKMLVGHEVIGFDSTNGIVSCIHARSPRRQIKLATKTTVLATGKFIGGGINGTENGFTESIFDLETVDLNYHSTNGLRPQKFTDKLNLSYEGHSVFSIGVPVDRYLRPINYESQVVFENLFAAGSVLAGYNYPVEKSGLGVGLTTGYTVGTNALKYTKEEL